MARLLTVALVVAAAAIGLFVWESVNFNAPGPAEEVWDRLPVALVPGYLSVMERPGYDPFRSAVEVSQWRRQWVLWRAARRWSRVMRR